MGSLKPVDRIQIYTGSRDRVSGTTGNFTIQASNQLFHSPHATYKVYLQQVVMLNAFESNIGMAGSTFGIERSLERLVNTSNNTVTIVPSGTGYTPLTITLPNGTYNASQLVTALNAVSNPSGGAPFPSSTTIRFTSTIGTQGPVLNAQVYNGAVATSIGVDFTFPRNGAGAIMGFGTKSSGQTFGHYNTSPSPILVAQGPLAYYYTLPTGNPTATAIVASLNSQSATYSNNFAFSIDAATGNLDLALTGVPGQTFDLDLTQSKQLQDSFGFTTGFVTGVTQTPCKLLDQAVTTLNIHSSLPTSHYAVAGGQLSLSNMTASVPVLVGSGQPIVYTDLEGANATYEKNQDRLVNLSFRLADEFGEALLPADDWYCIITVEVYEDVGNQETALLAEQVELLKEQLRLQRVALSGMDYSQQAAMHDRKRIMTERPMLG